MKFSENWLRTFVDPPLTSEELAHELTMAGLEVEAVEAAAPPFDGVVVAEVLSVEKHPGADRLSVCKVNVGETGPLTIVCGASNVVPGAKVPCARVGAQLPGLAIKAAKVRGVESYGMLCSAKELGASDEASGLLLLPADAPVGTDFREYYELEDRLFTLKLTPNRSDCLSVMGVAREVAAITATNLRLPEASPVPVETDEAFPVEIAAPEACPLYCGRVVEGIDVNAPTPDWMVRRLERSGLRSISATVDVTNYVMLEMGQPLHAFDLGKLSGGIVVRFARQGERLALLNDQAIAMDSDMLVIADREKAVALGGIMGGAGTAVSDSTRDLFLEAAFFNPKAIAGKSFRLGFVTDSGHRFERGVDFAATRMALERATQLIVGICGGRPGPVTEARGALPRRDPIRLRVERARRVLGVPLDDGQITGLLRRLGMSFAEERGVFHVTPQSYRFDLAIEEDLIEELARLHGYDNIPAVLPSAGLAMLPEPEGERHRSEIRQMLVARDYQEVINYAFVDAAWEADFCGNANPVALRNPIASQMSVMRSSLAGGLIQCLRSNVNRRQGRVRLFELGCVFARSGQGYDQPEKLGGLIYGETLPEQWDAEARRADFYDLKADLEALLWPRALRLEAAPHPALHPGRAARIRAGDKDVGWIGELHPEWQQKYELPQAPVLFEVELRALCGRDLPASGEISRFPPVRRDIAILVDEGVGVQTLLDALRAAQPPVVSEIALFDLYRGQGIEKGKKSLAFRVLLQDTQKTLTDAEVDAVVAQLVGVLEHQYQAKLRT
ncbi:MAG: phenylalanine--tRNA ligase subunit beta [Betaproteobacteria bacterium]|nr:phenylalanine--tRNA ligase subunit beta [Betaproteobacteria bacterium]